MKKSIRRGVWAAPGTYRGIGQAMASTNRARKTNTKTNTRGSGQRGGRRRAKPKPDMNARWSILLFGIGVLVFALIVVPGASVWNWVRTNILFGVFGVGSYVLAPMLLYIAVLVACERPVKGKLAKALLVLMLVCGTFLIFSKTDLTGLGFWEGMAVLRSTGASEWGLGGGMLGAVFGWTLLLLCGRPGANILIVIFMLMGLMLFTGVTPADIWYFFSGHAGRMKDSMDRRADARAQLREARAQEAEQARLAAEEEARRHPLPAGDDVPPFDMDAAAYEAARSGRKRRAAIDINIGGEAVSSTELKEDEKPVIGPGGTFGMYPGKPRQPRTAAPAGVPAPSAPAAAAPGGYTAAAGSRTVPQEEEASAPVQPQQEPPVQESAEDALASLVKKAAGPAPELVVDANDQLTIAPAAGEGETGYAYPPLSLFRKQQPTDEKGVEEELTHNADLLVKTLSSFGVQTRMMDISRGPSVTRYELQPLAGVKISRITGLADDIALNLATAGVRIEAPIPGKAAVGIEVPNRNSTSVSIRSILESPVFTKSASPLTLALGKDIAGACQVADLTKMPHLLIAGSTGSGKSVCINAIVMSFLYKSSPEDLKLIMIDPKVVELAEYNGIPHLLMPVVTEPRKAAGALGAAVGEMEKRYHLFAETNVRDIKSYNRMAAETEGMEKLPYIAIVIDELADLMMVAGKEVEDYICRIAQKARAAGMHLIVATQRPSVDVITGLIKANIPSRIAFAVSSQIDSRTILDAGGAEKLLGMGDMLFMPVGASKPVRIQGTYVRDEEISDVLNFIKKHSSADYSEEMIQEMDKRAVPEKGAGDSGDEDDSQDPMLKTAVEVVIDAGQASTSLLQRRCKLGYARAARIMDEMEQLHIIGPYEGSKPRQVLITRQQWIEMTMQQASDSTPEV